MVGLDCEDAGCGDEVLSWWRWSRRLLIGGDAYVLKDEGADEEAMAGRWRRDRMR